MPDQKSPIAVLTHQIMLKTCMKPTPTLKDPSYRTADQIFTGPTINEERNMSMTSRDMRYHLLGLSPCWISKLCVKLFATRKSFVYDIFIFSNTNRPRMTQSTIICMYMSHHEVNSDFLKYFLDIASNLSIKNVLFSKIPQICSCMQDNGFHANKTALIHSE